MTWDVLKGAYDNSSIRAGIENKVLLSSCGVTWTSVSRGICPQPLPYALTHRYGRARKVMTGAGVAPAWTVRRDEDRPGLAFI